MIWILLAMVAVVAAVLAIGAATRPLTRDGDGRLALFLGALMVVAVVSLIFVCGGNR